MSIMDLLGPVLGGSNKGDMAKQIGADEGATENAMGAGLATLMGALQRNAAKPGGAEALHAALSRDHDGAVLNHPQGLRGAQSANGAGMLKHILGDRRGAIEQSLGKSTGLNPQQSGKLLETLAPAVLGALGKQQREQNLDAGSLAGFLGKQNQEVEAKVPQASMIGKFLDQDGDGDFDLGDIAKVGLGKLFGKK